MPKLHKQINLDAHQRRGSSNGPASVALGVWYDNSAGAAFARYAETFPTAVLTEPHAGRTPAGEPLSVGGMLGQLPLFGINGGPQFPLTPAISIFVRSGSAEDLRRWWGALTQNTPQVYMELQAYDWSPLYGWCADEWGLTWQLMLDETMGPDELPRFTPAMLFAGERFGRAEAALRQYESLFDGADLRDPDRYPAGEYEGKVLFAELSAPGGGLIAMDGPGAHAFTFTEGVSLVARCADQAEIDRLWDGLTADGGTPGRCGWLKDRFGVSWQIIPADLGALMSDPARGPARKEALMGMGKIEVTALEGAGA